MHSTPKPGAWFKVPRDINCIPAGVYRLVEVDDVFLHFRIGKSVHFCMTVDTLSEIERLPMAKGLIQATSLVSFVDRYYALVEASRNKPASVGLPFTMCAMSSTLQTGMH